MTDVLAISTQLRKERLQRALKNKGSNQEIQEALAGILGNERQKQLLGITDDKEDSSTAALMTEALETFHQRSKVALEGVLRAARQGGATREQIGKAIADVLGVERQRQLWGAPDDKDQKLSLLLSEAAEAFSRAKSTPANRVAEAKNRILMEPPKTIGRFQVR